MRKYLLLCSIALLEFCCNTKNILQGIPEVCDPSSICSFESDPNRELIRVGHQLVLNTYSAERMLQSSGEVEEIVVKEVSYVLIEKEKIQKVNYRISVCYHGLYKEFYPNGMLKRMGKYKHGCYVGKWREFDENGVLKSFRAY